MRPVGAPQELAGLIDAHVLHGIVDGHTGGGAAKKAYAICAGYTELFGKSRILWKRVDKKVYECTGTTYLRNAGKGGTGGGKCGKGPILGGFAAGRPRNRGGMSQLF